ncbi:hypothetical protein CYMTET_18244 [Cymbomonas tetramitiformis]|uniref:Uncharacterized protein n=1 Tax=Cymbomonas tetramitiformis TaxID=36881 RepID=A0AAE0G8D5_9CHLO|nr:hypothetical protein CYMTET_18244 [Cymbomonas tetramitiformis]
MGTPPGPPRFVCGLSLLDRRAVGILSLSLATTKGATLMARAQSVDLSHADNGGRTPAHSRAAGGGHVKALRMLWKEAGAKVDAEDGEGRISLTLALAGGHESVVAALLEAGAGVNAGTGQRPVHAAAERGMVEMLRVLVDKGAEVDAEDGAGRTALTVALAFGQEAAARALLEAGAGVNAGTGRRPLHGAAEGGMMEILRELVDKGADVEAEDGEGRTALMLALVFGQEAAAQALLEAGAGVKAGTGQRPLHAAARKGMEEMARELVVCAIVSQAPEP